MSRNIKSAIRQAIRFAMRANKRENFDRIFGRAVCGSIFADVWLRPNGKIEVARIRYRVDGMPGRKQRIFGDKRLLPDYPPGCENE